MLKRFLASTAAGALMVAGSFVVMAPAVAAEECPGGSWPAYTVGRPTDAQVGMTGLALWRDGRVAHLRVSEAGLDRAVFRGTISTDGVIFGVGRHLEGGDVTLSRSRHWIAYRFVNYGGVDGIDFSVRCASFVRFGAGLNGTTLTPDQVVIGEDNTHPPAVPFRIVKA